MGKLVIIVCEKSSIFMRSFKTILIYFKNICFSRYTKEKKENETQIIFF